MAQYIKNTNKGPKTDIDEAVREFVDRLTDEHCMLIILKYQLYGNQWDPMLEDLKNRLAGKPYIFKLVNRIKDDIERIETMQTFEARHGIDLSDFVSLE